MIIKKQFAILFTLLFTLSLSNQIQLHDQMVVDFEVNSDQSLTVKIELANIELEVINQNNQDFTSVSIPGQYFTNTPGFPQLPQINQLIEIPYEATPRIEIINITEEIYNLDELGFENIVSPAQPSLSKSANPNDLVFVMNNELYTRNEFINSETVQIEEKGLLRAVRFGNLMINPIDYNPVSKELKVKKVIEFNLIFDGANYDLTNNKKAQLFSPYFEPIYQSLINYTPLSSREDMIADQVSYVIVANDIFEGYLDEFVEWKTKKGFNIDLVYTNQIGSSASNIKSYIMTQYNNANPAPSFVLIVGDTPQVPASYSSGGHVSDLDYCDMTNNGIPDILMGRFSAQTPTQLLAQIEKTVEYEKYEMSNPEFLEDVIMISGVDANYAPTYGNGQINYGNTYYFNGNNNIDSHTFLYPASGSSGNQILSLANQGAAFINYTAHGWESGWADPEFDLNDANTMTNSGKYPTMVGNCCLTNAFDSGVCFGEALLRKNNGGSIGYIGGSDVTYWNEDFWWGVGSGSISSNPSYNATGEGAYDGMFHENGEENWAIVNAAIMAVGNLAVVEANGMDDYYWEIYHLMGDPSLSTYFGVPTLNNISHDVFVPIGVEAIEIEGDPHSYIGISQDGTLYGSGTIDESGFAVIVFDNPVNDPGMLDIVVTAQNKEPYFGEILVASPDGPYITVTNIDLDYGTDNIITSGETVDITVTIENLGNESSGYTEVSLVELIDNPYISIINESDSITNLLDGSTAFLDLSFNVASTAPFGHSFALELILDSDDNNWNNTLNLTVGALIESFENASFSDVSWEFSGDADWNIDSNNTYEGNFSAQSGQIDHNMTSDLSITMEIVEAGTISFYKKVSCEDIGSYSGNYYDYLAFYIDGVEQNKWAGEIDWSQNSFNVSAGEHTFTWSYSKDQGVVAGQDAVWIDNITFPPVSSSIAATLGDLNNDEIINVLDIVLMVNIILDFDAPNNASDMNSDGITNVLDVILLVNLVLDN